MSPKYWFLFGSSIFVVTQSSACSSKFGNCETTRSCSVSGSGGTSNPDAVGGAAGAETEPGGNAGEAGAAMVPPALFGECSVKGEVACDGHASARRLACDGAHWQAGTTCGADQLCDSTDGSCAAIVPACSSATPGDVVCQGDVLLTCGADLVTAVVGKTCDGRCELGACQPPACGDDKVQAGEDCDDAEATASGACIDCKAARCGDGALYAANEQCDDSNEISGDGCSAACKLEPVAIALGGSTTCALSADGRVKCWGDNESGVLGLGDTASRGGVRAQVPSQLPAIDLGTDRKAVAISVSGANTACALLDNGGVKCWGSNRYGQLGTGTTDDRGDEPGEMGDALAAVPLGAGRKAIAVSAGSHHTCAVLDDGGVKCWGSGANGELGRDDDSDVLFPEQFAPINLKRSATSVSAADGVTCALLDNGTLKCWGSAGSLPLPGSADLDGSGSVGDFSGEMSALPALSFNGGKARSVVAGVVSEALLENGSLVLWGFGYQGWTNAVVVPDELAVLPAMKMGTGKKVKSSDVDAFHACAVLDDGAVKCWGYAPHGALGLGAVVASGTKSPSELASVDLGGHAAVQIAIGREHSCALLDDATLRCWGYNNQGQLGLGDTETRGNFGERLSADTLVDLAF